MCPVVQSGCMGRVACLTGQRAPDSLVVLPTELANRLILLCVNQPNRESMPLLISLPHFSLSAPLPSLSSALVCLCRYAAGYWESVVNTRGATQPYTTQLCPGAAPREFTDGTCQSWSETSVTRGITLFYVWKSPRPSPPRVQLAAMWCMDSVHRQPCQTWIHAHPPWQRACVSGEMCRHVHQSTPGRTH